MAAARAPKRPGPTAALRPAPVRALTPEEQPYTVAEVAKLLRVSKMSVYRLTDSGELGSLRVGRSIRIPADSYRAYLLAAGGAA